MTPASSSATATWPTIRRSWCRSLALCRRALRWRSRPPTAGVGWSICSRSWSWNRIWSIPAAARRSPRPGSRTTRSMPAPWRSCCAPTCCPRPGSPRSRSATCARWRCHRASLVRVSTTAKNRIHAVLADRGIQQQTGLWTGIGRVWLAELALPPTPRAIVEDYLALLDGLAEPIARLEHQIHALAKPDPRVQALMALPGVGRLTAMTLVAEIGDIARFPTARKLCTWAGLTPAVRNLRPQGPPRPHHQTGLRCGCAGSSSKPPRPPSAAPCSPRLRPARPPPGQADRHRGDRPPAAGPLVPHPQSAGGHTTGEGQTAGCARNHRMRLQHGR
jgi:Transposase IS116/IS110/IS902 family